jgi:hypothetical protein
MGVTRSVSILARIIGPAWAGLLFSLLGKDWPYLVGAAIMVGVVFLGLRATRSDAGERKKHGQPG